MLWYRVGVHFDMRELRTMSLEVNLEVSFRGKSASANVTLVRAFSCVGADMYLKGGIGTEDFTAVSTTVFEERFVSSFGVVGGH